MFKEIIDLISDMKDQNPLASEINSVSFHRSAAQHGKGSNPHLNCMSKTHLLEAIKDFLRKMVKMNNNTIL